MTTFRSAVLVSILASASPLAAQTALSDRPGLWISAQPRVTVEPQVLTVPESAPLITGGGGQGVILEHRSIAGSARVDVPDVPSTRPQPRPERVEDTAEVDEALVEGVTPIFVSATSAAPRPERRPREVAPEIGNDLAATVLEAIAEADVPVVEPVEAEPVGVEVAEVEEVVDPVVTDAPALDAAQVADAAALAAQLAADLATDAHDIMASATRVVPDGAPVEADGIAVASASVPAAPTPRLAPTPVALNAVAQMSTRNQPAALSAVLLPNAATGPRPAGQPVAFAVPRADDAPVLSRPRPVGPEALEQIGDWPQDLSTAVAPVLLPDVATQPGRAVQPRFAAQPMPDMFPYSALPPEILPGGPDSQARAIQPPLPAPEAMAAVLMVEPRPAPDAIPVPLEPNLPVRDDLPVDPDAVPDLPVPDAGAVTRMIADAAICWRFAELSPEAGWASLSVEVALDEMNMPAAQSIRLTGFSRVMSSDAEEAFEAAQNALIACAEASGADPATRPATLMFDRNGVRLR